MKYILSKNNQPWIYLLCLWFSVQTGVSSQYTLDQSPSFLSIQERTYADLNCTYQKKTFYNFVWFKQEQEPGKELVSLSLIQSSQKEEADKNFKELLGKEKVYSVLHISGSHPGDSATYFCALHPTALQAPAACPTTAIWASWQRLALGWEWRCFLIHRGSFLKISVSKQKSRMIYPSLMWWTWIYIELNFLLLLLKVHSSVQIVLHKRFLRFCWFRGLYGNRRRSEGMVL